METKENPNHNLTDFLDRRQSAHDKATRRQLCVGRHNCLAGAHMMADGDQRGRLLLLLLLRDHSAEWRRGLLLLQRQHGCRRWRRETGDNRRDLRDVVAADADGGRRQRQRWQTVHVVAIAQAVAAVCGTSSDGRWAAIGRWAETVAVEVLLLLMLSEWVVVL